MNPSSLHFHLQRLKNLLRRQKPTIFSAQNLLQIHSQLITTGLHHSHPSSLLSLLNLSPSNPSALHHSASILTHFHLQAPNASKWSFIIQNPAFNTDPFHVFSLFKAMQKIQRNDLLHDPYVYASLIKACNKVLAFREGKSIHCHVVRLGLDDNVNILNSLICLYSRLVKSMRYAHVLFDKIPDKTVVTVNCMISGFLKNGLFDSGLGLFDQVLRGSFCEGLMPNHVTLVILISGCVEFGGFCVGKSLHSYCWKTGFGLRIEVSNVLIDFYANFGYMNDAMRLFNDMQERDLVSWNTMLAGYARSNNCRKVFALFKEMRSGNIGFDRVSLISLILASANSRDVDMGKAIHGYVKTSGVEFSVSLGTALINMYSRCGLIQFARKVYDELPDENIAPWNSMIHGYVECGCNWEALELFHLFRLKKLKPDETTMIGLISACRNSGDLFHGVDIHSYIETSDHLNGSVVLHNALIDMYAKCGSMTRAKTVFDKMPKKDVISWTSMIVGHAINGEGEEALVAFRQMVAEQVKPNVITFIGVLSACDHAGLVDEGQVLYDAMCRVYHIEPGIEHYGCMVDMHARAGMLEQAHKFVKDMPIEPNAVVWRMLVNACRVHANIDLGLSLVNGRIDIKTSHGAEDHVISSNIYAEARRWDDVLSERSSMAARKTLKAVGTSSVSNFTE